MGTSNGNDSKRNHTNFILMKYIAAIALLTSCSVQLTSKSSIDNSIKNIQKLKQFVSYDAYLGKISEGTAHNYYYILEITEEQLKQVKYDK